MRAILIALLFLIAAPIAGAQESREEIIQSIQRIPLDPVLRANIRKNGFTGERYEIVLANLKRIYGNQAIVGFVTDYYLGLVRDGGPVGQPLEDPVDLLMNRGFSHLSTTQMRTLLRTDAAILRSLSQTDCGKLVKGTLHPERASEKTDGVLARLDPAALRAYYDVQYAAAVTGLSHSRPRALSRAEVTRVENKIFDRFDLRLNAQKNRDTLYRAWQDPARASNRSICTVSQLFLASVLDVQGPDAQLAMIYFMQD
ncbi:hypothetical protein [Actibacterium ureilyticum]|uniref:hypothetical protein n=1 Tax=Actibacterium ureilyticum TaxID=1590614 RepID=UPI000BAAB49F|nr:hypothetical protein [Actibacterium ureilyticum]